MSDVQPLPEVSMDKLQAQLLRSCKPAVRKLARAARGRSDFHNDIELRACVALARLASDLLYARALRRPIPRPNKSINELLVASIERETRKLHH